MSDKKKEFDPDETQPIPYRSAFDLEEWRREVEEELALTDEFPAIITVSDSEKELDEETRFEIINKNPP